MVQAVVCAASWASAGLRRPIPRETLYRRAALGARVLEIGPFDAPALHGVNVRYFDVLDQDGLRKRAADHGRNPAGCPVIDFVSSTGDLGVVNERFDSVLSVHVLEHQPDLIRHLNAVADILVPGGSYYLVLPDKRYCFDHYIPETQTNDVWAAHLEGRQVHGARAILNHRLCLTHNRPFKHWLGVHGPDPRKSPRRDATEALKDCAAASSGAYVDVHAWFFTPQGFRSVLQELHDRGLCSLRVAAVHATAFGSLEFCAVLTRPSGRVDTKMDSVY